MSDAFQPTALGPRLKGLGKVPVFIHAYRLDRETPSKSSRSVIRRILSFIGDAPYGGIVGGKGVFLACAYWVVLSRAGIAQGGIGCRVGESCLWSILISLPTNHWLGQKILNMAAMSTRC